jgi:hypothetical protein
MEERFGLIQKVCRGPRVRSGSRGKLAKFAVLNAAARSSYRYTEKEQRL